MATKERMIIESLFMIADKEGNDVEFKLNSAQARLDSRLTGRDIIPKARQEGISSYFLARGLAKCLSTKNTRAVVISHDKESTERMLLKVHYMLQNIRGPKALIRTQSKEELTFPKTNSMFYIGTAGARKFGRGDTITSLHCSEVAFWNDPRSLLAGLFQAVPITGELSIESTGNGVGNWYHRAVMHAASGMILPGQRRAFRLHFFDWLTFDEYCYKLNEEDEAAVWASLSEELGEIQLVERFPQIKAGQLAFRRDKILAELDGDVQLFRQEYPATLDECFQTSNRSIFQKVNYVPTGEWIRNDHALFTLAGHPRPGSTYSIGADVSAGIGGRSSEANSKKEGEGDRSVAQVVCLDTLEQVGEWASNETDPATFGKRLADLGRMFNGAFLTVEGNNHGIVTMQVLKDCYPMNLLFRTNRKSNTGDDSERLINLGFKTTVRTKPLIIGNLRTLLSGELKIHSPILVSELDTFVETSEGQMCAEAGCFDDRVLAMALAVHGVNRAGLYARPAEEPRQVNHDPFLLENILDELHSRRSQFPIDVDKYVGW